MQVLFPLLVLYSVTTLISMSTMSIGAGMLALGILLTQRKSWATEFKKKASRNYLIASAALFLAVLLSLLVALELPLEYGGKHSHFSFLGVLAKCWYLFWPIALVIGLRSLSERSRQKVMDIWLIAFGCLSVLGIFQYFYGWPRPQVIPAEPQHFHATLFLGHHLSVASIFIFPFFTALDLAWIRRNQPKGKLYFFIALAGLAALYFTYSRTLWVALPLGIIAWILGRLPRKLAVEGVLMLILVSALASQYPPIANRIHDALGVATRQDLWQANWEFFKARPLTGVGLKQNQELSGYFLMEKYHSTDVFSGHAHNNFLDFLGGTGGIGLACWLAWCLVVLRLLFRKGGSPLWVGWACAWMVFHINGLTQVNFWEGKVQHQLAWIIAWSLL